MKHYQISINQQTAATLDELEAILKMPKEKIIQKGLSKLKEHFSHTFIWTKPQKKKKYLLDELVGSIDIKGKKTVNFSEHVDDIYRQD